MVKLIRLTSENNGRFNIDLDAGIPIGEGGSIALQNLTFESEFTPLTINDNNKIVSFTVDSGNFNTGEPSEQPPFKTYAAELEKKTYTASNWKDFIADLQGALNSCMSVGFQLSGNDGDVYGNWAVRLTNDFVTIHYKYSPLSLCWNFNDSLDRRVGDDPHFKINEEGFPLQKTLIVSDDASTTNLVNLGDMTSIYTTPTADLSNFCYAISEMKFSDGNGAFMIQLNGLADNGGAKETNGYGFGLTYTDLEMTGAEEIPESARDFEMEVYRPQDPIGYHNNGVFGTAAPHIVPVIYSGDPLLVDRLMFVRSQGMIMGHLLTGGGAGGTDGVLTTIFQHILSPADRKRSLYPYIFMRGGSNANIIGQPTITFNSLIFDEDGDETNHDFEKTGLEQEIDDTDKNQFQRSENNKSLIMPLLNNARFAIEFPFQKPELTINSEVLRFLGFGREYYEGSTYQSFESPLTDIRVISYDFQLDAPNQAQIVNSDNYVVILDSNPLMSYDASQSNYSGQSIVSAQNNKQPKRGRRLNILATIAVNDNSGYLEYRANELVYIDLDNKYPQIIKNLVLRVLNKNLEPIQTNGSAVMTLLIKDRYVKKK